jgi:hypothetical protein
MTHIVFTNKGGLRHMHELLSASKVAQHLDISVTTLTNWYKWYDESIRTNTLPSTTPPLPAYLQKTERGPRQWYLQDLPMLESFQKWIPKGRGGLMGDVSSRYWGKRDPRKKS